MQTLSLLSVIRWALSTDFFQQSALENSGQFKATLHHFAESMGISEKFDILVLGRFQTDPFRSVTGGVQPRRDVRIAKLPQLEKRLELS